MKYIFTIIFLHIAQPLARLYGRFGQGLTPWRKRGPDLSGRFSFLFGSRIFSHWSEEWRSSESWLIELETKVQNLGGRPRRGGDFDNWDLQAGSGLFARARGLLAVEEHGGGKQYLRFRCSPRYQKTGLILPIVLAIPAILAFIFAQFITGGVLAFLSALVLLQVWSESARAMNTFFIGFKLLGTIAPEEKLPEGIPVTRMDVIKIKTPERNTLAISPATIRKRNKRSKTRERAMSDAPGLDGNFLLEDN